VRCSAVQGDWRKHGAKKNASTYLLRSMGKSKRCSSRVIQRVGVFCVDIVSSGRLGRDCVVLSSRLWTRSQCQNPSRVKWQFLFSDRGFGRLYEGWRDLGPALGE
jgi:hypothetical protein